MTPVPKVNVSARRADTAMSMTSPAVSCTIMLPAYTVDTPMDSNWVICVPGIDVPFRRTASVTDVPRETEAFSV